MSETTEHFQWLAIGVFSLILVIASVSDIRSRIIPNWTVLAILLLYVPVAIFCPLNSFLSSCEAILIAFAIGWPVYAIGMVGAGDSKLLMAVALFVGISQLYIFFVIVALTGGAIAAVSLLMHPTRALVMFQLRGRGDFGPGIPYGVAISVGAFAVTSWPLVRQMLI